MKGALSVVLKQCSSLPDGSPLTCIDKEHYESAAQELALQGLRGQSSILYDCHVITQFLLIVVAMASGPNPAQLSFVGLMGMWDPPRSGVIRSVATLLASGVAIKMITGDARETGEAIGLYAVLAMGV